MDGMADADAEWEILQPEEDFLASEETPPDDQFSADEAAVPEETFRTGPVDRSRYALVSGLGFFLMGIVAYFFIVVPGDVALAVLSAAGMALTAAAVYFWMADDLRFRPRTLSRSALRFIAGPLLGLLAIVGFATLLAFVGPAAQPPQWGKAAVVFLLEFGAAATVSLLFYSLLWTG